MTDAHSEQKLSIRHAVEAHEPVEGFTGTDMELAQAFLADLAADPSMPPDEPSVLARPILSLVLYLLIDDPEDPVVIAFRKASADLLASRPWLSTEITVSLVEPGSASPTPNPKEPTP